MCGLPEAVRVVVLKLAWPLAFTAVGPASVVPGAAQVPPSMKVTLPAVGVPEPDVTVAVNVTDWPNLDGLWLDARVVVGLALLTT